MDKYWQAMRVYIHTPAAGKSGTQISPLLLLVEGKAPNPQISPGGAGCAFLRNAFWPLHGQQKSCADLFGQIFDMQLAVCCPALGIFQQITGIAKMPNISNQVFH